VTQYFLDSSAIIKRYIVENGTSWIRQIAVPTSGHAIVVAQITPVEIISGLARQMREGQVMPSEMRKLRLLIEHHIRLEYFVTALNPAIIRRAEDLLLRHPLRAYDAVQLASALDSAAQSVMNEESSPVFVSADRRLLAAAEAEGLTIEDPNQYA